MARKFSGMLPDGRGTTKVKEYIAEWDAFTKPLCERLGVRRMGFDPGLLVGATYPGSTATVSHNFDTWMVRRLNAAMFGSEFPAVNCSSEEK